MPKYNPLVVLNPPKTYSVTGIVGQTAGWQNGQDSFQSAEAFTVTRRAVAPAQTTRKSTARLAVPLVDVCESTCTTASRGSVLCVADFTFSNSATLEERTQAVDAFIALISTEAVREAIINNESFYA